MNRRTIAALDRINRRFYRRQSEAFSRTRKIAWPGWRRVATAFQEHGSTAGSSRRSSILDVGCGNGRYLAFLQSRLRSPFRYVGVDASLPLLAEARQITVDTANSTAALVIADLVEEKPLGLLRSERFDLAVAFGILHHIPSKEARLHLLTEMGSRLRTGGILAVSFWQFGEYRRFLRRSIPWEEYNRRASEPIDLSELEEGDLLMAWGDDSSGDVAVSDSSVRYCHFTDANAAGELVGSLPCELVSRFSSDGDGGKLNLYFLLKKSP